MPETKIEEITSNEELNTFAARTEKKLNDIEVTYASKFEELLAQKAKDEEEKKKWYDEVLAKHEKENAEYKAALELTQTQLKEVKEVLKLKYTALSEDEKMVKIGQFLLAARQGDYKALFEMGGKINTASASDDWKGTEWEMKAAPDLGAAPLRGDEVTGSILVPELWAREILRLPTDPSALMGKVRNVPMGARKINFPGKLAGVSFAWPTNEITLKAEKLPTLQDIELEAKTAAGYIAYTEELNEDSVVPLVQYFTTLFQEAWEYEFDFQCLTSNAAPFTGVLREATANIVTMAGSTFGSVTLDDLMSLIGGLDDQSKRNGASFMMHVTILDIVRKLRDDNGEYIYAAPGGTMPGTIWGYPVILSDACPDLAASAASTPFIAFGNPKWILHGNRVGINYAPLASNGKMKSSLIRGNLNLKRQGNPELAGKDTSRASVETLQEPSLTKGEEKVQAYRKLWGYLIEIRIFDQTADTLVYDRNFLRCRLNEQGPFISNDKVNISLIQGKLSPKGYANPELARKEISWASAETIHEMPFAA